MSSNPAIKRRPPRPRNKAAAAPSSSSGQVAIVDGDGFILKKTRHGRRKPPVSTTPQAPNPSRSTRNQRRRRNKQQQQREGGRDRDREDEKESELDDVSRVADDIQAYYPQLTDRRVLESAIKQLRLRSFDPTDEQILDIIANIQTQSLLHPGDTAASKEVSNDSVDDDDEDDDDDDDEDDEDEVEEQEQEEDEYEDEEEEYENDDDEDEDDEDDDDGDDDDGDEEDDDDEDDDDDEEDETIDHEDEKESSEAPMKYETSTKNGSRAAAPQQPSRAVATSTSAEDADKKRKRNRRRRRKKSATDSLHNLDDVDVDVDPEPVNDRDEDRDEDDHGDGGDEDDDYEDDEDVKEEDDDDASRSVSQSRQHKKKRSRTKHKKAAPLTLGEELKSFDLSDVAVCIPKLQEWVARLQTESKLVANANAVTAQTRAACSFLREFLLSNGIEILVERVLTAWPALQASVDSRDVELLSRALISIWDATLSGSHSYHEWLFDECVKLSAELAKLASTKTMNDEDVHGVIREQCKHLVAAQKKTWIDAAGTGATTVSGTSGTSGTSEVRHGRTRKNKKKLQASNVSVHAPFSAQSCASHLLSAGHHANDPIVSVVQKLDPCVDGLSACYAELSLHDDSIAVECATQRASFANDYRSIEASVDRDLQFIGHRSSALERELLTTQSHKQKVVREQQSKVAPLEQRLEGRRRERAHLQQEQEAIEAQLAEVRQRLATCDVFVAGIEQEVADILRSFEPSTSALFSSMDDYQFEIAAYAQQRECYANLLQVVRASFQRLQSWSRTRTQNDSEQRVLLETQYVQELSAYFDGLCGVLQMLVERVAQLKEHMAAIERTHAVRTRNYGRASRGGGEESAAIVKQLERDVVVDEETMARMREVMHLHLQTAASIVSKPLFAKFVGHIEQRVTPTQIMLDLAPYRERERPPMHLPMHHAQQQQASNDVHTQTHYGASAYHAAPSSASTTTTTTVTAAVPPPHSHGHRSSSTRASAVAPPQTRDRDRERDRVQQQHHFRQPPQPQSQQQQQSNGSMSQARKPPMSTKSAAAANKQQQQQQSDSLNGNKNASKKPPLSSQSQSHQQRPPRRQQQQQQPRRAPVRSNSNANAMYY